MLEACTGVDHQIRSGVTSCVGSVFGAVFGDGSAMLRDEVLDTLRESFWSVLLRVCQDPVGTVRTEGARVLGEAIAQGLLIGNSEKLLTLQTFSGLHDLMGDSELAARMQA